MKFKSLLLLSVMALLIAVQPIQAAKSTSTKSVVVSAFTSIVSSAIANIVFTQGNTTSVVVKGDADAVNRTKVNVQNNKLVISTNGKNVNNNSSDVTIYVTAPSLQDVDLSGVGTMKIDGKYKGNDLNMKVNGTYTVNAPNLDVKNVNVTGNGVGNVTLGGKAQNANFDNNGVGKIDAQKLKVQDLNAQNNGVGNINCRAENSIDVKNNGVGNVNYSGKPSQENVSKNGIGNVNRKR
jgi:hypothetical protein